MILLMLISWAVFWIFPRTYIDALRIKRGQKINHTANAWFTCLASILYALLFGSLFLIPLLLSSYWFIFDPLLNKLRGKDYLYLGKTAFLDKIFHSVVIQLAGKVLLLGFSAVIYIFKLEIFNYIINQWHHFTT